MSVLLPCGITLLLVLFWAELPLLDRWVLTRHRADRPRLVRLRRPSHHLDRPAGRPVQAVAADLRRLGRQLAMVPAGAPVVRWRALWSAYDDVLVEAAELLEVPHTLPGTPEGLTRDIERLRLLAALEGAGLVVRG